MPIAADTLPLGESCLCKQSGSGFLPGAALKIGKIIMALVLESPLLFSLRICPALAQPQLALRLLAARRVDQRPLALSVVRLALRPDPHRQAATLEVCSVVRALLRLGLQPDPLL